jgi:hypothetical protein
MLASIEKENISGTTYFLTLNASNGRLSNSAIQYPLIRNKNVRKPCTAASGMM